MQGVLLSALCSLCLAAPVAATELIVRVRDAKGLPVADAVVTLDAPSTARAPAAARTLVVDQRNESFVPYVSVARPGDRVVFRNSDTTRHHVYSFSETRSFQQLLVPGDSGAPLTLGRAGLVAVGCNIHDHMRAWLVVTPAAQVAISGADGVARFAGLPAGTWQSRVWHPHLRPKQPPLVQAFTLAPGEAKRELGVSLRLLPDPRGTDPHRGHY
ncbi:MAG: methylamine utilization protein [Arenimonas sp.]